MLVKRLAPLGIALIAVLATILATEVNCPAESSAPADNQRQTALALEQAGRMADAEAAWRALLKLQAANPEAYAHLGFLEARQERYTQAVPLYRKALALDPAMPGLRMNLGLALFKAGELKEAIQTFNRLLHSRPPSPEAGRLTILIGMAHYGLGEYAAAVPYLKQATASDPENLPFRLMLAHSCLGSQKFQCVLDVYHEILTLNAESAESDMLAGEALDAMKDHLAATQQFRAAVKANPREPNVHFGLGYLLWGQNQYQEAAEEFQAELANVPDHVQAMAYLADADIKLNRPEAALPLAEKAIQMNAGMELAHLDLGILYANAGRQDDAVRELKTAVKLSPKDVNPHWRLARLYRAMGRKDEANAEFQKTSSLTKAADASIYSMIEQARAKSKPPEGTPAAAPDK
jgi:tetratricopeptide (TPR) repeat protein